LARSFDHKRMKDASTAILKEMGDIPIQSVAGADAGQQAARFRLSTVAHALVDLQQARHKADYDVGEPFGPSMRRWMSLRPAWPLSKTGHNSPTTCTFQTLFDPGVSWRPERRLRPASLRVAPIRPERQPTLPGRYRILVSA
jgi:hypothetical protein